MPVAWLDSISKMPIFNLWRYVRETEDNRKFGFINLSEDPGVSEQTDKIFLSGIYMSL